MVFAYDFPLLSLFWAILWFSFVATIFFAVIWSFIDNFRRSDHHGWAKAGWAMLILLLPLVGTFAYLVARPVAMMNAELETTSVPAKPRAA